MNGVERPLLAGLGGAPMIVWVSAIWKFLFRCRQSAPGRSATVEFGGRDQLSRLHLRLLGDLQSIVYLDSEVADGAFEPMSRGT